MSPASALQLAEVPRNKGGRPKRDPRLPKWPPGLEPPERQLWDRITAAYDISDEGGLILLEQAMQAAARVRRAREIVDREGEVIASSSGRPMQHPAVVVELQARKQLCAILARLGLDLDDPTKTPTGKPRTGTARGFANWQR